MLSDEQLQAIQERADKAIPGEWYREGTSVRIQRISMTISLGDQWTEDNAEFIAHARTDIPLLLAEVARLNLLIAGDSSIRSICQSAVNQLADARSKAERHKQEMDALQSEVELLKGAMADCLQLEVLCKCDEDIPDDKEEAYRLGYRDALMDVRQALQDGKEREPQP